MPLRKHPDRPRSILRFPESFTFRLAREEFDDLKHQILLAILYGAPTGLACVLKPRPVSSPGSCQVHHPDQGSVGIAVPGCTSNSTEASSKPSAFAVTVTCPGVLPACRVTKAMPLNTGRELA